MPDIRPDRGTEPEISAWDIVVDHVLGFVLSVMGGHALGRQISEGGDWVTVAGIVLAFALAVLAHVHGMVMADRYHRQRRCR